MKKTYTRNFYLKRFQEVVIFLTAVNIKKRFSSLEAYQRTPNKNKAYPLGFKWDILRKLSRIGGHKHFKAFCRESQSLFIYHGDYHSERFNRNAWFELSDKVLEDYFSAPDDNFNTRTCHFLSKEAHKFIDKHVYDYKKMQNKDNNMTKAEKEKIRQECAEGKHACSADYLIKQREKDERRQAKKQQRMIDKSNEQLQQALKKIEELEKRNAQLEAQLKDTSSYVIDEQDRQLIADCEACLAGKYPYNDDNTIDGLTEEQLALIDETIEEYKKLHRKAS